MTDAHRERNERHTGDCRSLLRVLIAGLVVVLLSSVSRAEAKRFLIGDALDVQPRLHGPALNLAGGGPDLDAAIQWMIDEARGCADCHTSVDVVVLRASGGDGYNQYIFNMNGVDSVETLVVSSAKDSNSGTIASVVRNAEVVFFAGGDQCNYIKYFMGTAVEAAVESVYARGGAVGGTSAGLAIMTPFIYDACSGGSSQSVDALADPYHEDISFSYDFFNWRFLEGTFSDTHFVERNRLGRLVVFLARQFVDGMADQIVGIGVDRSTALLVDRFGVARVEGEGPVILVLADHPPEVVAPATPLTFCNLKVWKFTDGQEFSLRDRPRTGYCLMSVNAGRLQDVPTGALSER